MTDVLQGVLRFTFTATELNRIQANIEPDNVGSWRAAENARMQREGLLREYQYYKGRYRDLLMYAILRREWEAENRPASTAGDSRER